MVNTASVQTLATQAAADVYDVGAVQFPSDLVVPWYYENGSSVKTHPTPFEMQPVLKLLHAASVFVLAGASLQINDLQ